MLSNFTAMDQKKYDLQRYNLPSVSTSFYRVLKEYLIDFPNVDLELIKKQFLLEIDKYTDLLFTHDPEDFEKFIKGGQSTHGVYLLLLHQYLHEILKKPEIFKATFDFLNSWFLSQKFVKKSSVFTVLSYFFCWNSTTSSLQLSTSSLVYILVNILYILYKNSGITKLLLLQKLACFVLDRVPDSVLDQPSRALISIQIKIRIGHCLFFMFTNSVLPKISNLIEIIEQDDSSHDIQSTQEIVDSHFPCELSGDLLELEDESEIEHSRFFNDQGLDFTRSKSKIVRVSFKGSALQTLQLKLEKKKKCKTDHLHLSFPMLVPPKKWKIGDNLSFFRNNTQYYNTNNNYSGGLLLNGILIFRPLCKLSGLLTRHSLEISTGVINYINKMQEQPLCLDNDLLEFYLQNKSLLPKFLSDKLLREKRSRLICVRKELTFIYHKRAFLVSSKTKTKQCLQELVILNKTLSSLISEKKQLVAELEDYRVLMRLLSCADALKNIPIFFFSYEVDFRMRLYCHPLDISFMGSKLMRSLIRFKSYFSFNLDSFKLYSSLQYTAARDLSEVQILELFNIRISNVLESCFILSKLQAILLEAREPFLFMACAFEWLRYCSFVNLNKSSSEYISNFPIYLDCSANGPQLISLLFALEDFAKFLNLCPQNKSDIRGDFYSELIADFLKFKKKSRWSYLKQIDSALERKVVCGVLRKSLKVGIMTQFYGVRYRTFLQRLMEGFYLNKDSLAVLFNFSDDNFYDFVSVFSKDFWSFLQNLSLFKLKAFLLYFQRLSKVSGNATYWSVFNSSFIKVSYGKPEKIRYGSRVGKDRAWFVLYQAKQGSMSLKQHTALMANFVHSLDAYVIYRTCSVSDFPILPIHDSFGVPSCYVSEVVDSVRFIFSSLVDNQNAGRFFITQLADIIIQSTEDASVKEQFLNFVEKDIKFGSLTAEDVKLSYYCIYYA